MAFEIMAAISYGRIVVLRAVVGDRGGLEEVPAAEVGGGVAVGAVHILGQQVEAISAADGIGMISAAVGGRCTANAPYIGGCNGNADITGRHFERATRNRCSVHAVNGSIARCQCLTAVAQIQRLCGSAVEGCRDAVVTA